ncbi:MAG: transcriptional regulator [Alphaproteobacteria bacterium]|nr:MAG: transcriptional regulator [Alphaproteobacteria bacterium]
MRFLASLILVLQFALPAQAAELVMFEQKSCVWCRKFDREIAPAYDKTTEGNRAPLRRLDIALPAPSDLAFIKRERFTPVFVLIDGGREIGRIRGYPGDTFFWGLLANLLERLDRGESATPEPPAAPPPGATFAE